MYFSIKFLEPKLAFTGRRNNTGQLLVDLVTPYCQYPSRPVLYQVFYQEYTDQKLSCPNGTFFVYISVDVQIYLVIRPTNTLTFLTLLENMNNTISILHTIRDCSPEWVMCISIFVLHFLYMHHFRFIKEFDSGCHL